jgi:hypothetical protein
MAIDPISLKLAEIILKWTWDKASNQIDKINFNTPFNQNIAHKCQAYIDSYHHRYGKISVLGMPEPVKLENIYTNVQIIEGQNLWKYGSRQAEEEAYRNAGKRSFQSEKLQKQGGIDIANKYQYLMVLGQPGAGKSTFLKRIGLAALYSKKNLSLHHIKTKLPGLKNTAAGISVLLPEKVGTVGTPLLLTEKSSAQLDGFYIHQLMPVLIELKRCNSEHIDLVDIIQSELEICGFENANTLTQTLLTKGGMLILLDGLDEIPSQYLNRAIIQIQDFVNRYRLNRFIISCRTAAYQGGFNNLTSVEMADFDDEQIQEFINNWFCREQDLDLSVATACWQLLNADDYQATKELAHTPLLLTFLCLVYDESQVFPKNRAALYKKALDILLYRWAAEKRIQRDPIYKDLTIELEEMLLAKIAYQRFNKDLLFFDKQSVVQEIREYLAENLNAPKHLDGEHVLREIQVQQGILVGRSSDTLSFSHLTLQEYLTAQYIVDWQLINELVSRHLTNPRWREVFLLVAGLMRNGSENLLKKMAIATSQLTNTKKLCDLVNWSEKSTEGVKSKVNHLARRNLALAIVYAHAYACSITYADTTAEAYEEANAIIPYVIINANANVYDYAIVNANNIAKAIANAEVYVNSRAVANVISESLNLVDNLTELQIFDRLDYLDIKSKIQALKNQIPDHWQTVKIRQKFAKKIAWVLCKSLQIELDWLDLSIPEIENLYLYFTANLLIMQCREARAISF